MIIYALITVLAVCTILISFGMIRYDATLVRFERASKKFPYAKWKKARPLLHVYIIGGNELDIERTLQSLKKISYRKKIVSSSSHIPKDVQYPCLIVRAGDIFDRDAIKQAVQLSHFQDGAIVEVASSMKPIKTIGDVFTNYTALLTIPFSKAIQGLHIRHFSFRCNVLYTTQPKTRGVTPTIDICTQLTLRAIISAAIIIVTYLAAGVSQPQLLLTMLLTFMSFAVVIIWIESPLSTTSKFLYTALVPVILPYFYTVGLACFLTYIYRHTLTKWRTRTFREYANS